MANIVLNPGWTNAFGEPLPLISNSLTVNGFATMVYGLEVPPDSTLEGTVVLDGGSELPDVELVVLAADEEGNPIEIYREVYTAPVDLNLDVSSALSVLVACYYTGTSAILEGPYDFSITVEGGIPELPYPEFEVAQDSIDNVLSFTIDPGFSDVNILPPQNGIISDFTLVDGEVEFIYTPDPGYSGPDEAEYSGIYGEESVPAAIFITVVPDVPPVDEVESYLVYELDKGWTFDGRYIPHFLELNWYFGDNSNEYHSTQKVRIHGLSKGRTFLTLSVNGMQTNYDDEYTEPQWLDLPRNPKVISVELKPETNYTDTANRGISLQMKFEGRNTDISLPEPQHAIQVLVLQSTPPGIGHTAN